MGPMAVLIDQGSGLRIRFVGMLLREILVAESVLEPGCLEKPEVRWVASMPVSATAQTMPLPVAAKVTRAASHFIVRAEL